MASSWRCPQGLIATLTSKPDASATRRWLCHLRRPAVRTWSAHEIPRSVAMKLTGQKTESVYGGTLRYAIVSDTDLPEATRRLERGGFSGAFSPRPKMVLQRVLISKDAPVAQ
jgi:hypothetical protein